MDYTLLRRELIYRERRSLEEFAEEREEMTLFIDNIIDNYYFSSADGKERALRCFNKAYYIYTLILLTNKHPEWNFMRYCDIAYCGEKGNNVYQAFTLSLVYIFLTHTFIEVPCKKLLKKIEEYLNNHFIVEHDPFLNDYSFMDVCYDLLKNAPKDLFLGEEFAPRKINRDIIREIDRPGDFWYRLTNYYERQEVKKIVDSLGKNEGEKHILIEMISQDAQRYYGVSSDYYQETVKPMLEEMDEWIFHKYNDAAIKTISKAELAEMQYQGDVRPYQARISELEKNLEMLKDNGGEQNRQSPDIKKTIEEQAQTIKDLLAEIERLKTVSTVDVDMNKDIDDVNKWAKVIFFATVLNAAYQKKFTIGQQLALFICQICGGKPSTYQPLISKIASMEDNEKDKSGDTYLPQVIKAAKEIVNRLVEIPEGDDVHPTIQKYIDSICDEFCIEKPKKRGH